jgi:hypothetical protein
MYNYRSQIKQIPHWQGALPEGEPMANSPCYGVFLMVGYQYLIVSTFRR